MTLIDCRDCGKEVSRKATICPNCGARLRKARRGFFGQIFKWTFVLFNGLMLFWLVSYWNALAEMNTANQFEQAGKVIGGTMGTGALMSIWMLGAVVLGLFTLLTRPRS